MKASNIVLLSILGLAVGVLIYFTNKTRQIINSTIISAAACTPNETCAIHYEISDIKNINLTGIVMNIQIGDKNELSIASDSATLSRVTYSYSQNELTLAKEIQDEKNKVTVDLTVTSMNELSSIELTNAVLIFKDTAHFDDLSLDANQYSVVQLTGNVKSLTIHADHKSQIKAFEMMAEHVIVDAYNQSDVEIKILNTGCLNAYSQSNISYNASKKTKVIQTKDQGTIELNEMDK